MEIASCMEVVFLSVQEIDWLPERKLLWTTEMMLSDEYEICEGAANVLVFDRGMVRRGQSWRIALFDKLAKLLKPKRKEGALDFLTRYQRDALTDHIIDALRNSGRDREILVLCEKEAQLNGQLGKIGTRADRPQAF